MTGIKIEQVGPEAAAEVLDLVDQLLQELGEEGDEAGELDRTRLEEEWAQHSDRHLAFLARNPEGEAIAVATLAVSFAFYADGEFGVIDELYVAPGHRSLGVGELLLEVIAAVGKSRGWARVDVTAPESDRWIRTQQFYARNGFEFMGPKMRLKLR